MPAILKAYPPVTAERLLKPADGDWLMIRRTYDGWGYSPLDQITPANVSRLQPVWVFSTGATNGHEAPPIVNNGVMFVVDAGQPGDRRSTRRRARCSGATAGRCPRTPSCMHPTTRGVALYGDKVFFAAGEGGARRARRADRQGSLDHEGRRQQAAATTCRWRRSSPSGKVMVGASGGEFGIRGFVAAYDPETGKEVWKTYTVPAPGEPAARRGRRATSGRRAARRSGSPATTIPKRTWLLGHRQRRAVDGRPASRRQSLHGVDGRDRRRDRPDQGPLPIPPERLVGLGRSVAADPRRLPAQRPHRQGPDRRRAQRLPVVPRARRAARSTSSKASRT